MHYSEPVILYRSSRSFINDLLVDFNMQFEQSKALEVWGYRAGFLFSYSLMAAIAASVYAFTRPSGFWLASFKYFLVLVLIIFLIALGVKRLLR